MRQMTLEECLGLRPPPPPTRVVAGNAAVAQFWVLVQDFVLLNKWPHRWLPGQTLPVDHPFIARDADAPVRDGIFPVCLRRPPDP